MRCRHPPTKNNYVRNYNVMNSNNNHICKANKFTTQIPKVWCPGIPSLQQASLLDPVTRSWDKVIMAKSVAPAGHTSDGDEHCLSDLEMKLGAPKTESPWLYPPTKGRVTWEDQTQTKEETDQATSSNSTNDQSPSRTTPSVNQGRQKVQFTITMRGNMSSKKGKGKKRRRKY